MKKTSLSLLLSVMLLLLLLPTKAFADESELVLSPETGENKVKSISDGEYQGSDFTSVTIKGSIDSIGFDAFMNCDNLTSVTIEGGVGTIDGHAFQECNNLTTVTIQGGVGTIGDSAFQECTNLTTVTIQGGISTIDEGAFFGNNNFKIVIDGSVDSVNLDQGFPYGSIRREYKDFDGSRVLRTIISPPNIDYSDAIPSGPEKPPTEQFSYSFQGWALIQTEDNYYLYTPTYTEEVRKYAINFQNFDGKNLQNVSFEYNSVPTFNEETPTKASDSEYTYTFAGWKASDGKVYGKNDSLPAVKGEATYTAIYTSTLREYEVKFLDDDGTVLDSATFTYGTTPEFKGNPNPPFKEPDAQYTYTFAGWQMSNGPVCENGSFPAVKGDTTYTATYTGTLREYEIRFMDEEGNVLQTDTLTYGEIPKYNGDTPSKEPDAQYTYTFGWKASDGKVYGEKDALPAVGGDATYTVSFTKTVNEYTVTFVDEEGKELQSGKVAYGQTPVFKGEKPTKEATAQYTYSFAGWDKEIAKVTGDATYKATYTSTVNEYTITFVDEDGKKLQSGKVAYGETPEYKGEKPTKEATAQYTYTFGWKASDGTVYAEEDSLPPVAGDAAYTVLFKEETRKYMIQFRIGSSYLDPAALILADREPDLMWIAYGERPKFEGEMPTKAPDAHYTYTFAGWLASDGNVYDNEFLPLVTCNTYYVTVFTAEVRVPVIYTETKASGNNWTKGSTESLVITIKRSENDEECFSHFGKVQIDGKDTEASASPGSTIITISAETLETLSIGEHTVTVIFDDGDPVEKKITIQAKPAESNTPQKGVNTGDRNHPDLWISLLVISLIGIGAVMMLGKKRMN